MPSEKAIPRRAALVLGVISLPSPLSINMYVPAFPSMAIDLGTGSTSIQLSLVSFVLALAIGQSFYGSLSDRFGRKAPLYGGFGLFVLASAGTSLATTGEELIAWRFLQGWGACAPMVVARAIVRDSYTGPAAARMMGLILLVVSIAPLVAPLAGTGLTAIFGWRSIFWFLTAAGCIGLGLVWRVLPESLPQTREPSNVGALQRYRVLLQDKRFLALALMVGFGQATYFAYLTGSPFVFMTIFGLNPWEYSILFALGAASWAGSAQAASWLMGVVGVERLLYYCVYSALFVAMFIFIISMFELNGLFILVMSVLLIFSTLGIISPVGTVIALHPHSLSAGSASALIGTAGFAAGAIASAGVTFLTDETEVPMLGVMAACAMVSAASASFGLRIQA